jgi:hypothetical protein
MGLPEEGIIVLRAYFDESEREGGIFCIAGFVFQRRAARMFVKDWSELFPSGAHMVDLLARRKQFKNITEKQRDNFVRRAVPIIKKHSLKGVIVSCNIHEVRALSPRWICGFGDAYPLCCHLAMFAVGKWLRETERAERVAYVFEAGHELSGEANRFMTNVLKAPELQEAYCYHAHAFVPKADAIPLQAADFLAWVWGKFRAETLERKIRPPRGSLVALVERESHGFDEKKFIGVHVTGEPLAKYLRQIRKLGLEQLEEEGLERKQRGKRNETNGSV